MDWRKDVRTKIEAHRGPGETDVSLAGRGGIGPKALYDWLHGNRRPRESTWERVTKRWRATQHLVDPDAPVGITKDANVAPAIQKYEKDRADGGNSVQTRSDQGDVGVSTGSESVTMGTEPLEARFRRTLGARYDEWWDKAVRLGQDMAAEGVARRPSGKGPPK